MKTLQKPFILTIFGASGDLAKLKIFPSIFSLAEKKLLPKNFYIVGYARSKKDRENFQREFLYSIIEAHGKKKGFSAALVEQLISHVYYFSGQYDQKEDFVAYRKYLSDITKGKVGSMPHIAYFSVPPFVFHPIIENLALARKSKSEDIRIVLEKPFGDDEESAQKLFHFISQYFQDKQIYLLDHYLGKPGVQSILSLRHANSILNMLLKGREIATIQMSALEDFGVEERIGYFDEVGIMKDMFQSHLTQILAMITMSIPLTETAESFQREKYAILSALKFSPKKDHIYLGQYKGYRDLEGVKKGSNTETFMSVKIKIDRESWYGVPIFIRTGKKIDRKITYVVIEFKKMKFQKHLEPNRLIIELQPDQKIHFKLLNKHGHSIDHHEVSPSESIACGEDKCLPEHATLLLDVLNKDKLHFLSFLEVLAAWRITDSILGFIKRSKMTPESYEHGTPSPQKSEQIFHKQGEGWFEI